MVLRVQGPWNRSVLSHQPRFPHVRLPVTSALEASVLLPSSPGFSGDPRLPQPSSCGVACTPMFPTPPKWPQTPQLSAAETTAL